MSPELHPDARKIRLLFVPAFLDAGPVAQEILHLARHLPRVGYAITVLPASRGPGSPGPTLDRLHAMGARVDTTAFDLSFADTVTYLARRLPRADLVVSWQDVADIYPALERLALRPPLIERGFSVREALSGPKHFTARYVGVSPAVREAAAGRLPERPHHAIDLPAMIDLPAPRAGDRARLRAALGLGRRDILIGWAGAANDPAQSDRVLKVMAQVAARLPQARFLRPDGLPPTARPVPGIMEPRGRRDLGPAMDVLCWWPDDGEPLGDAARVAATGPAVALAGEGGPSWLRHDRTALVTPHHPVALARAVIRLAANAALRSRLGATLRADVAACLASGIVVPEWERLFAQVLADVPSASGPTVFQTFLQGGWECSTHVRADGRRLDVLAATRHDTHAEADYRQLGALGLSTMRDGLRWHRIESTPGTFDFSSWTPMLDAAKRTGTQVIWDLLHYGWPDGLDIWRPDFVQRFAAFARAAAIHRRTMSDEVPFWCPVNEMSFHSWGGGDVAYLNPHARGRGFELKCQLASASIAAMRVLREVDPRARFVHCEPMIAVHHDPATGRPRWEAEGYHDAQFQAFDLVSGRLWPMLGGQEEFLDVVGVNYYFNNQWVHGAPPIDWDHPLYAPLSDLLFAVHARYGRPVLIAETGVEWERRAPWFRYVSTEVERARARGVPVEGICLYPIANHPGWDDDRDCPNGLLGAHPGPRGRDVHEPLAAEILAFQDALGARRRRATG
ncbi:hypothetical protein [Rubellimicrobium arenae]|uniref:hypothetical protein n=1 Tax=Rubellimicrobium arenae TaxID=2817372 RepID=UPI001B30A929|nr:hypothetical protein [Rubellimicrobium arenae]